jgi:DNA-directed RNA polymerase specialized sigma24 family protein
MGVTEDQALDHRLVDAARRGDEKAFAQLVERYTQNVFATVVAVTNEFQIAPDITQETFLRAWFGLVRLEDANSFGPWIRTIARNRSRTWLSQRSTQRL